MNKRLLSFLIILGIFNISYADTTSQIKEQFCEYYASKAISDCDVAKILETQQPDGTWPDVDYKSKRRGDWPTLNHLKHVLKLSEAYVSVNSKFYKSNEVRAAILKGHWHWLEKDYKNPNWWQGKIGIPQTMAKSLILLGDDLPPELLQRAQDTIFKRSEIGMTGQNKVWLSGISFMKGLLADNQETMNKASTSIWSELVITTKEGIQPDWTFHQHGPQLQVGNYGLAYGENMIRWASILRNTEYALTGEKLSILRNYILHGASWFIWNTRMDISGCGRQVDMNCQSQKARWIREQINLMPLIDPAYTQDYQLRLNNKLNGFKGYWRSETAIQRRPDWYGSVKMSSKRVIGAETCNSENMQGLHLGDGVCLVYLTGDEYKNIQPLWDWRRLPGTTCDQRVNKLTPRKKNTGGSLFSGVIGDNTSGAAAMIYKRNKLVAHKSWFFSNNSITCLGAGISGETSGNVYTSIEQSLLHGTVTSSNGTISDGTKKLKAGNWVHHAGVGYHLLNYTTVNLSAVNGSWLKCYPTRGDRPATGDVFGLWINHGRSPSNKSYAYVIYPNVKATDMKQLTKKIRIVSNTSTVQAIQNGTTIQAVFYKAAEVKTECTTISVNAGCMVMLKDKSLMVSDPTHKLKSVKISIDEKTISVTLPTGAAAGKSVHLQL